MADETIAASLRKIAEAGISSHSEGDKQQTFMSAADLLKLADRIDGIEAAKQPHRGVRFTKLIPPGTG